jgi:hypothetical protein
MRSPSGRSASEVKHPLSPSSEPRQVEPQPGSKEPDQVEETISLVQHYLAFGQYAAKRGLIGVREMRPSPVDGAIMGPVSSVCPLDPMPWRDSGGILPAIIGPDRSKYVIDPYFST